MICIYCAIGQRSSAVAKVIADLREHDAMPYSVSRFCLGRRLPGPTVHRPLCSHGDGRVLHAAGPRRTRHC